MSKELDPEIVNRALEGEEDAFAVVYRALRNPIYNFSLRLTNLTFVAADVTQDTFLHIIANPASFDFKKGSLKSFLFGVARNKCLNHLRSIGKFVDGDGEAFELEAIGTPLTDLLDRELSREVNDSLALLPPLQREAILLREVECMSYAEIAVVTGTDVGTVKSRLFRARKTLSKYLADYLEQVETNVYEVH